MEKELPKIDFRDFPKDDFSIQIEGKLFISDNLWDNSREPRVVKMSAPVQLSMTAIIMCVEGEMKININMQEFTLKKNCAVTMMIDSFMQVMDVSDDFKGFVIAIKKDFMNFTEDVKMGMAMQQHTMKAPFFSLEEKDMEETMMLYKMMKRKLMTEGFFYKEEVAKAYLDLFKYNGFQSFLETGGAAKELKRKGRKFELLERFIKEVQEHYTEERQVTYYADLLCINPKYLSSIIHEVSGKYASEWIDDYVILEAKALLRSGNCTIKELCARLHFSSQSMFSKYFKQHTGMTPKDYRG